MADQTVHERLPMYIELAAKKRFEHRSERVTGKAWNWNDADVETRMYFRVHACLDAAAIFQEALESIAGTKGTECAMPRAVAAEALRHVMPRDGETT